MRHSWCDLLHTTTCRDYQINICGGETPDKIGQLIDITGINNTIHEF